MTPDPSESQLRESEGFQKNDTQHRQSMIGVCCLKFCHCIQTPDGNRLAPPQRDVGKEAYQFVPMAWRCPRFRATGIVSSLRRSGAFDVSPRTTGAAGVLLACVQVCWVRFWLRKLYALWGWIRKSRSQCAWAAVSGAADCGQGCCMPWISALGSEAEDGVPPSHL